MKDINDLRATIAQVIGDVRAGRMDTDTAKVLNSLLSTAVDSAKVEVMYCNLVHKGSSQFFDRGPAGQLGTDPMPSLPNSPAPELLSSPEDDTDRLRACETLAESERDEDGLRETYQGVGYTRTVRRAR